MVESIIIYIDINLLERKKEKNRYLISISDRKNNLFSIDVFNGTEEQAKQWAGHLLKLVKEEYKYNPENKTIRCYK